MGFPVMNGIVTRHYLRQRFWIATLVLLTALAVSAGVMILAVRAQADRGNYLVAFHHLDDAAMNLEMEFARLSLLPDGAASDRQGARAAFVELLTEFRAIGVSDLDEDVPADAVGSHEGRGDHLTDLGAEFGIDAAAAAARWQLDAGSMPEALVEIWEPGADGSPLALEIAIARLLRLAAPLVRGEGGFSDAERRRFGEIETLAVRHIRPTLTRVVKVLDAEVNRTTDASVVCILALTGLGFAAALFNFVAIFRPLTNTVMANQAEIIAERDKANAAGIAKRNFLSVVSHELRTPMNGVLGFASLLAASELKPGQRKQVEIIQSSGKILLALVDDILDFTKLEAGSLELAEENFSIEEVVSDVVALLRAGAAAKHLEMSVCLDARLPEWSRGDAHRLRQVLTNLVGNAIKFTDSGHIGIEAREVSAASDPHGGCELEFAVSDTGIGIPAGKTELIFERFTQIDSSPRRKWGGTGLGLSICKQLVERMGGRIWVESTPGAGSTFFVRIPLAAAAPPVAGPKWRAGALAALSGRRVLVVDGHSIGRRLCRLQLECYGLRVDDAADAQVGWTLLEQAAGARDPYAVAILDQIMPDTGAVDLARRIRADGRFTGLRLLLSTTAATLDLAGARELGFDAVEEKPVLPRALIVALRGLIGDDPTAAGGAAEISPGETPAETDEVRILLVEDNQVARRLVLEMLSRSRYRVDTAGDGLEAVRAAARQPYDLILMDIRMPAVGGVEATRRIRSLGGGASRVPIIALTASAQDEDVAEYHAAGMQGVVAKPVERDILLATIDAALDVAEGPGGQPEPGPDEEPVYRVSAE